MNVEGIGTITYLLDRLNEMQQQIRELAQVEHLRGSIMLKTTTAISPAGVISFRKCLSLYKNPVFSQYKKNNGSNKAHQNKSNNPQSLFTILGCFVLDNIYNTHDAVNKT